MVPEAEATVRVRARLDTIVSEMACRDKAGSLISCFHGVIFDQYGV